MMQRLASLTSDQSLLVLIAFIVIEFSIIVPVLHEQEQLTRLLPHLATFAQDYALEVILVDGDRNQSTLRTLERKPTWLKTIASDPGRSIQMNQGAKEAQGQILLFLHADTQLPANSLQQIQTVLDNPNIQAGAHDLCIASNNPILTCIGKISSWRSRLTRIPYGDQAIFVRRNVFEALGGYPDIAIMEDVAFMEKLKHRQAKIHILPTPVLISDRRWQKEGIVYTTLRNWLLLLLYKMGVSPDYLIRLYKPHHP